MRVIEADKLIMKDLGNGNYLVTAEAMANARTFEAEPVRHGYWTDKDACSICGYGVMPWNNTIKYCPNCGAKMDKEVKNG